MKKVFSRYAAFFLFSVLLTAASSLEAAGKSKSSVETYQIRAIVAPPGAVKGSSRLSLLHEAIPEFRHRDGSVAVMPVMVMPFMVQRGISTDLLEAGDKVEVVFEVHWDRGNPLLITALKELPPDTELALDGYSLEQE